MKSKTLAIVLLVACAGCYVELDVEPVYFFGNDTAMTSDAATVSYSGDLVFRADLFLLMGVSRTYDLYKPFKEDVLVEGEGTYAVNVVEEVTLPPRSPGATLVLVDQSGTYDSADALNYRSKLINQFLHELNNGTPFMLGGFANGGLMGDEPVETASPQFTSDADAVVPFLFEMPTRTGGTSALYDAMLEGVSLLSTVAAPRTLLVLAHGPDAVSASTADQVIAQALANNVRIDFIYVGEVPDALPLTRISAQTGGFFSFCPSYMEMVTSFNHLNRIYAEGATLVRIEVTFTPSAPLGPGVDTFHSITIHDPYADMDYNLALVVVKTP